MKAITKWSRSFIKTALTAFLSLILTFSLTHHLAWSRTLPEGTLISFLASGDAITDPESLLRYALPIDNSTIRQVQKDIEDISNHLRGKRWNPITRDLKQAIVALTLKSDSLLESIPLERQTQGQDLINQLKEGLEALQTAVESKEVVVVATAQAAVLKVVTGIEELMVANFPFIVPSEYAHLPQLKGRAVVSMETTQGKLTLVIDGYNAPVNAGNFVDLVNRGFYDGLPFTRAEEFFVVQAGDPDGKETGFIDPSTGEYRAIPLEIFVKGEPQPIYGTTLEEAGFYLPELALPFNAYGAVALARPENEPNGGSSQFFFYRFDTELTPPGFNLMDGRYSVFGYLVDGEEVLGKITADDKIISAKVVAGLDNLVEPQ